MGKVDYIIQRIKQNSQMPIQNEFLFRIYLRQSLENKKPITFYNWECPPRFLDKTKAGQIFINYDVGLESVFKGKKIDKFTELPRVIEKSDQEKRILRFLDGLGIKYRFVKLIADTNAFYLTPESIKFLGQRKITKKFNEFENLISQQIKQYPAHTRVYLFTNLIKKYKKLYDDSFNYTLRLLQRNPEEIIPNKTLKQQFNRTKKHLGFKNQNEIKNFSFKTIASYAAEGMILNKLSKTKNFSNCVWLNIEEVDQRTIKITNCLRIKRGIDKLPMIFLKL